MKSQQSGFTLVEIAIVLVIIGLLLGGILKGQELINSAKVKNLANDFRVIPTYIYAYQDKFKALPGDDPAADTHLPTGVAADKGNGNGVIDGAVDSPPPRPTKRSCSGSTCASPTSPRVRPTSPRPANLHPKNAVAGIIGVSSVSPAQVQITGMTGTYQICSKGILGKFAKQLDIQMDDGNTQTGSMRTVVDTAAIGTAAPAMTTIDDSTTYTVCMTF